MLDIKLKAMLFLVGFLVANAIMAWIVYTKVLQQKLDEVLYSIECLTRFCNDYANSRNSLPLCAGSLELNALKEAIIRVVQNNHHLMNKQEDLFKQAAHELKTPLSILKTRVELFKKELTYDKKVFIDEANEDIAQAVHVLKELLFLKAVEHEMSTPKVEIDMIKQCDDFASSFAPIVQKKGLEIRPHREGTFVLCTHKKALQKVLLAMFENIFMHAKPNTCIDVYVYGNKRMMQIYNVIANENDEKLFSSNLGERIIYRLRDTLGFDFFTKRIDNTYETTIVFHDNVHCECTVKKSS